MISSSVLNEWASLLSGPLSVIFNKSLSSNCFPNDWNTSGSKSEIRKYRTLNILIKMIEKTITAQISSQVPSVTSPYKFGFLKKKSKVLYLQHLQLKVSLKLKWMLFI